ncbi:MAG: hypothetical protein R2932_27995 [Caldilineaceae bacterium]
MDGVNNIILTPAGAADVANHDRGDDGWLNRNASFADCQRTHLTSVFRRHDPNLGKMYLNVWFDGNRDGDWADGDQCQQDPNSPTYRAHEWIVQDFVVDMTAIPAGGFQDLTVNTLAVMNKTPDAAHWMRFMLSERPAVKPTATASRWPWPASAGLSLRRNGRVSATPRPARRTGHPRTAQGVDLGAEITGNVIRPGDVVTFTVQLAHVGGSARQPQLSQIRCPVGYLVGRPQVAVDGRISPVTVKVVGVVSGGPG